MSKCRVLYDFNAESAEEMTVRVGEELDVINQQSYEGWILVKGKYGSQGIVPSSYVEMVDSEDADIPPPPAHNPYSAPTLSSTITSPYSSSWDAPSSSSSNYMNSSYTAPAAAAAASATSYKPPSSSASASDNLYMNAWNVPSTTGGSNVNPTYQAAAGSHNRAAPNTNHDSDSDFDDDEPTPNNSGNAGNSSTLGGHRNSSAPSMSTANLPGGRHKARNSYGLDVFLLYGAVKPVPENEKQSIIVMNQLNQSNWKVQDPAYPVEIVGYTSDKKYHGVKKFTSYEIQTKAFNAKVKRRYNHFDWLHKRLVEKYPNVCIPSLPDKAVTGNFEDEFILKRKAQLELWLNRMSSHPVVGRSEVFVHFLQCDDTSSKWKSGKRKAEKDEYRGAQWFCTLTVPGISIDSPVNLKERVDKFSKASMQMDASVKNVHLALDKINTFNASYKRELTFMGKKLEELGTSIAAEPLDAPNNNLLSSALVTAGNTYTQIGNMYGEQAKSDINPLMDRIGLFRSILHEMPDIVQFEKNAIQTYEEFHQRPEKLEGRNLMEVGPRLDIVSHVTFAEINLFNRDKVDDLTRYMKQFLQQQIAFYTDVTTSLKTALAKFEQIPSSGSTNNKK